MHDSVQAWRDAGRFLKLGGLELFTRDAGPRDAASTVLVLHGFPTSSHDWHLALPRLAERRRIVLLDMPGYGLSDKPEAYGYSLFEQADAVLMVLRELGVDACHVVAHDMGTSVACELVARRERGLLPLRVQSLLLMNGSVHIDLAHLTPAQKLLRSRFAPLFSRVGSAGVFKMQIRRILARPVPDAELDAMWEQIRYNDGRRRLPAIIRYIDERTRFRERWIGALTRLDVPVHVLWGTEDPVAVVAIAEALAAEIPGATFERMEGLGHYPQIEDADRTAEAIVRFLDRVDQLANP